MDFNMLYPNPFEMNDYQKKARMFLGDRWVVVGDFVIAGGKYGFIVETPDVRAWLASREHLDDGTLEWAAWGPRVN